MLTVQYGPFQPALERAFLAELDAVKKADPLAPAAVVAPSRRMADRLQRLVACEAGRACLQVEFHTFYSLALEIVRESGTLDRSVVGDPMFFDRLLDDLLASHAEGAQSRPRGLSASYRSSLKDLIDAGVEPRAADLLDEGLLDDAYEAERFRRLLAVLRRYEERMDELRVTPVSGLTRRATEAASASPVLRRYRAILYYGFYDLTGLQADFFEAVAKDYPVTLFYPYRKGHPGYSFCDRFFETKLHLGGRTPRALDGGGEGRALGKALDALFVPGAEGSVADGALRFFTASGARDESWRVAKEVLRLVEEEGYAHGEIGVVARALDPYRTAVTEAFEESCIPFHMSAEEPLLRRPAARMCLKLLTLARRDFPALAVLDLTESPFFKGRRGRFWRTLVRRLRVHRGWMQWEGKLLPATRADFELYPQLAAEGRRGTVVPQEQSRALWDLLCEWRRRLTPPERRRWSEWADYACDFLREHLDGKGDPGFEEALGGLDGLRVFDLLGEPATFDEFLDAAEDRLTRAGRPVGGAEGSGVRVLDAMEARGESFRALFLVGMREGLFPRTIREDPLLRDSARAALRETGGYWIAAKQAAYDEEKLLFTLLAGSVSERLYCSHPRSDEEGRAQIPSIYLLDLCRAAGVRLSQAELSERVPRQPERKLTLPHLAPYLTPKEASVAAALTRTGSRALYRALGWDADGYEALARRVADMNRRGGPGPYDGLVGPPAEYLGELRRRGLSPSALAILARCPFQFYSSRVLGLEEPEEPCPSGEVSPAVKGDIYHGVLSRFYRRLRREGFWRRERAAFPEPALRAAEDEVFAAYGWRELGVYPLLWDITREGMRGHLRVFLQRDLRELGESGMRPELFEEPMESPLAVGLPEALRGMPFQGRADRVDVGGGSFRVVDYKSRWRRHEKLEALVRKGETFQPPVYLELAARHPRLKEDEPGGVRFCAIEDGPETNGRPWVHEYGADAHRRSREALFEELSRLAGTVSLGKFLIRPDEGAHGHCRWCPFGALCRKSHPMTLIRSAEAR
ncbi:MAG: PD-(D/E)XK nuclease family protein [Elusimicrobiota bacterium]